MWVTEDGRSFVRHYLIDFGSILGAAGIGKRDYVAGSEHYLDYGVMGRRLVTLGLAGFRWERSVDPDIPSVGFVEARDFEPVHWHPRLLNRAFNERTDRDVRWGARIAAGFTDDLIRAAVSTARYTDPRATEYVTRILMERRDKIVRRWLGLNAAMGARR